MGEVCVRVAVRIRPLLPKEVLHSHQVCVRVVPDSAQVMLGSDRTFPFDHAFGPSASQGQVYESCVKPLVVSLVEGYNATVFAYGQTGSGKTYTLGGGHIASLPEEQSGIICQVAADLFLLLGERKAVDIRAVAEVRVSYVELYREELRDLLELHTAHKELHIREDERGNTVVVGAREAVISSAEELLGVLEAGNALRHTGPTQMNERSSRSHAIITLQLTQHHHDDGSIRSSKLHLVDLAGSERAARTGNTGTRLKDSVHINTGLLALGNVIRALSDPHRRNHVPYRDAKITRLLRDSLGGSAHTLMLACVSPSHHSVMETLSVLQFASRARHVKNRPGLCPARVCPAWGPGEARMGELEQEVQTLREALLKKDKAAGRLAVTNRSKEVGQEESDAGGADKVEEPLYRCIAQEAALLLEELQSYTLSPALNQRLEYWLERHKELSFPSHPDSQQPVGGAADLPHHITILQLRRELNKCQDTVAVDEQVFDRMEAELMQVQKQAEALLQERQTHLQALQEERDHRRIQNEHLVEQQLLIDRLRGELLTFRLGSSGASLETGVSRQSVWRPHSVPLTSQHQGQAGARKIHSSPPACSLERVLAAFKTRSQLLLAQIEEKDEVLCPQRAQEEEDEPDEGTGFRNSMNCTWTSRKNPGDFGQNQARSLDQMDDGLQLNQRADLPEVPNLGRKERKERWSQSLKQVESQSMAGLHTTGSSDLFRIKVQRTDNTTVFQNGACKDSEEKLSERRAWLEQEEERALERRRGLQELEEELRRREEVLQQREACVQERNHLKIKSLRSSQALSQDLLRVSSRLGALDQELEARGGILSMEELLKERDSLRQRRDALEVQLRDGRVLKPQEEHALMNLEEALEVLDAAVEFKNRSIQERQRELLDTSSLTHEDDGHDVMRALRELSVPEASELLVKYFNKVVCLRESERRLQLQCEELQLQSGEHEAVIRELEAALQRLTLDMDRRLNEQRREHQKRTQLLLQQLQEGGSGEDQMAVQAKLLQLERDLFFYKSSSRELKKKLRELVTDSFPTHDPNLQTQSRKKAGDGAEEAPSLLAPVRLSRKELRQISPSELHSTRGRSALKASRGSFQEDSIEVPRNTD
ncbi:hypothetical protein UPYG_G00188350 [Umbra pygmaea]|uniref:Kinesin motor domain-containing protein n=1 Tax=Umbra pygmaea TaxID=75934 RepID=A0ABD0WSZ3_UMBPY